MQDEARASERDSLESRGDSERGLTRGKPRRRQPVVDKRRREECRRRWATARTTRRVDWEKKRLRGEREEQQEWEIMGDRGKATASRGNERLGGYLGGGTVGKQRELVRFLAEMK
jgi:hypothetical protein